MYVSYPYHVSYCTYPDTVLYHQRYISYRVHNLLLLLFYASVQIRIKGIININIIVRRHTYIVFRAFYF